MKILITGGAGFIGSHLAEALLEESHEILILDNFNTGHPRNVPQDDRVRLIEGSIVDQDLVNRLFDEFRPEVCVHCAASYKDPDSWEEDIKTNILGSVHVVRACERVGVKRLIYFETALCYGLRPQEQPITLNHPICPEGSSYAYSKTGGEQYVQMSSVPHIIFKLANVYGPRNVSGPLPTFYHRLKNQKPCFVMDTRRDFLFVSDLVRVVMQAIQGKGETGVYHVSSGSDVAIKDLFEATLSAMQITLDKAVEVRERHPDDAPTILLDPSKTYRDFAWKTEVSLEEGVRQAVAWYDEFGVSQTYTHLKQSEESGS